MPDQTVHCVVERAAKLSEPTRKTSLHESLAYDNAYAHSMRYRAYNDDGNEADLTGYSVVGAFTPSGRNTIKPLLNGTVSGNVAELILPSACYKHPGRFKFTMNLNKGSVSRSVLWVEGMVERNQTDTIEAPTEVLDVSQVITDAQTATANANAAVDRANNIANSLVNDSVNAITAAGTQQRQSVNDLGDQLKDYLEDHYGETTDKVAAKANRSSVSTVKHAIGADGTLTLTDALNEPAKKMTIHLEPKQDLHGYDRPWIGGTGKNLCAGSVKSETAFGLTLALADDGTFKVTGTYDRTQATSFYDANKTFALQAGTYVLSGTPNNDLGAKLVVVNTGTNSNVVTTDTSFTLNESATVRVGMTVPASANGKSLPSAGVVFKPMIRTATVTDPTYEPYSNICPIEGFDGVEVVSTGKNLCQLADQSTSNIVNGFNLIPCKAGDIFYVYGDYTGSSSNVLYAAVWNSRTNNSKTKGKLQDLGTVQSGTVCNFIPTVDGYFGVYYNAGALTYTINKFMISRESFSIDEYEPFGNVISLNLISSAGSTVYGGTVTVNEDGSGTLVVDTYIEDMGEIDWTYNDDGRFKGVMKNQIKGYGTANARTVDFACSCYDVISDGSPYNGALNGVIYYAATMLWTQDNRYTDSAQYKSAMSGQTVAYPLNDPVTYQLTAAELKTLVGTNHIWTDGTSIDLDYYSDKYGLVDRLLAAFPKDTATGNPATFTDGADDLPVEKLEIAIEPKQDLHGYDRPWPAGRGKNLLDFRTRAGGNDLGITYTNNDGIINVSGTSTGYSFYQSPTFTLPAGSYQFNGNPSSSVSLTLYNASTNSGIGNVTNGADVAITLSSDTSVYARVIVTGSAGEVNLTVQPMIRLRSIADSTYAPYENICQISGWDTIWLGENMYHKSNVLLGKNWINQTAAHRAAVFFQMKKGARYNYHLVYHGNKNLGVVYGENNAIGQGQTFSWNTGMALSTLNEHVVTNTNAFFQFQWNDGGQTDPIQWSDINDWEIVVSEVSENATAQTIPVKSIAGSTVYGGKLAIKDDGRGELVVDRAIVDLGSFNWVVDSAPLHVFKSTTAPANVKKPSGNNVKVEGWITSVGFKVVKFYQNGQSGSDESYSVDRSIACAPGASPSGIVVIRDTSCSDVATFKESITGVKLCYPISVPQIYPLTAQQITTLLGMNHISCDAGEVTVTYHADPTLFITKKIAQALNA